MSLRQIITLILSGLFLVIVMASMFLGNKLPAPKNNPEIAFQSFSPPADLQQWRSFPDTALGFLIKYPPGWFISNQKTPEKPEIYIQNYDPVTSSNDIYEPSRDKGKFRLILSIWNSSLAPTSREELKQELNKIKDTPAMYMGDDAGNHVIKNETDLTITDNQGYYREIYYSKVPTFKETEIFVMNGKGLVLLFKPQFDIEAGRQKMEEIIATLKFFDVTPIPTNNLLYNCPSGEWVDCMPGPGKEKILECTPEFLEWAKKNCPSFKGAAY